jgi:hypothetical protein
VAERKSPELATVDHLLQQDRGDPCAAEPCEDVAELRDIDGDAVDVVAAAPPALRERMSMLPVMSGGVLACLLLRLPGFGLGVDEPALATSDCLRISTSVALASASSALAVVRSSPVRVYRPLTVWRLLPLPDGLLVVLVQRLLQVADLLLLVEVVEVDRAEVAWRWRSS